MLSKPLRDQEVVVMVQLQTPLPLEQAGLSPISYCFVTSSRCGEDVQVRPYTERQTRLPRRTKVTRQGR